MNLNPRFLVKIKNDNLNLQVPVAAIVKCTTNNQCESLMTTAEDHGHAKKKMHKIEP